MKRELSVEEVERAIANIRTINAIEGIYLEEEDEAAGRRILSGQSSAKEEMARIVENVDELEFD